MRFFSRIAALTVLVSPALLGHLSGRVREPTADFPFRRPVNAQDLQDRGSLRFAISRGALRGFVNPRSDAQVDAVLLSRFADDLGVPLERRSLQSDEQAAQALRAGMVDVAVLPGDFPVSNDLVAAHPCPDSDPAEEMRPKSLSAFLRADSAELAQLLGGATRFALMTSADETLVRLICRDVDGKSPGPVIINAAGITRYAPVIAKYAGAAGLDWRLVAAVIVEESNFHEKAVSASGAKGLMQLMPWIPAEVGVSDSDIHRPEANIQAGVLYLRRLADQFPVGGQTDRLAMVLASYLLGPGHVFDAQDMARGLGLDARTWHRGIEETLPLLEDARFNQGTRFGYAHGHLAVDYVNRILERYELYRRHLDRQPDMRAAIDSDPFS